MQDYYMNDVDLLDYYMNGEDLGIPTRDPHVTIVNNRYVPGPGKKYIRTTLKLDDGTYVSARINTETGEIKPYSYAKKPKWVFTEPEQDALDRVVERVVDRSAKGNLLGYEPSWLHNSRPKRDIAETKADGVKPTLRKSMANPNRTILAEFLTVQDACAEYPWLEDILFGATRLDYGNTRPFSMKKFFFLLRDLDEINVETIYDYTNYSKSHCSRVAQHMRVLVNAFNDNVTAKDIS